ncbi:negative regulator of sigma E activity [Thiocystis violascens DSM 198]|uniref:Negative regulator of sigma E activity n=2 Tax=Thiocystis violascens TaxID=73141 RepID=I3Y6P0_THIV6|nr:negative regulator of sigma E activity [Thiocystis violascens DSM 198]
MTNEQRPTDWQRQRLSELQDGELDPLSASRLLDTLAEDASLRATWERYHLIGHVIRGEHCDPAHRAVAERVRRTLAVEPTRLQPRGRRARTHYRPLVGVAIAASVAFLAVFVAPVLLRDTATHPRVTVGETPLIARASLPRPVDARWQLDRPDLANKLDRFLVTHQETAPATGAKGMLHYATFVGYEIPR